MSVSAVSVFLAWEQGHGQAQADTGPEAFPDQQRSCRCLCVFCWTPNDTFSNSFIRAMAAAALRWTAKSLPGGASSHSSSPSSGQTAKGNQRGRASVLDSEHLQRNALTGAQHQPDTSPLDQQLEGSVQCWQAGNDEIP